MRTTNVEILRCLARGEIYWIPPSDPGTAYVRHSGSIGVKADPFVFDFGPDNQFTAEAPMPVRYEFVRRNVMYALIDGAYAIERLRVLEEKLKELAGGTD